MAPGIYRIRSTHSGTTLNFVTRDPDQEPYICIWRTTRSPTELWEIYPTVNGFYLRNPLTHLYMSYPEGRRESNGVEVKALNRPLEWQSEMIGEYGILRLASNPKFVLDIRGWERHDGSPLTIYSFTGDTNQRWLFEEVEHQIPRIPNTRSWIGRVPAAVYWLGQPHEAGGLSQTRRAASTAALTVASLRELEADQTTTAHLCAVGLDYPWPNQIWVLQPGLHGYQIKNMGTNAYLNYVNHEPVMDSALLGNSGITEWTVFQAFSQDNIKGWYIRPSSDHNVVLGVTRGDTFNQVSSFSRTQERIDV
ncbi:hypothetical protein FRC02_010786 [Tulasnella sp. 418]|nr:hypothetical protein FRC02_010786 [Tulasnella sp. 418]